MDPREQIRRFLEQRRELGETEFVLDTLGVDDVMRVLGARGSAAPSGEASRDSRGREGERDSGTSSDWRAALTAAGAGPSGGGERSSGGAPNRADAPGGPPRVQDRSIPPDLRHPAVPAPTISPPTGMPPKPPSIPRLSMPEPTDPAPVTSLDAIPQGLVVGSPAHEMFGASSPWNSLGDIAHAVAGCTLCPLYKTAKNPVPGTGNPNADFVVVGEAPGQSEDEQGVPFVGAAGQLLTKILAAIDLPRDQVFICNVLKHRPPGNRNPEPHEVAACSPYLVRQIELIRPKVLLALGTFAAQTLLQTRESIGKLRGRIHRYYGVPLVVTYHPAALLRNPSWKRPTWEDVQLARRILDRASTSAGQ